MPKEHVLQKSVRDSFIKLKYDYLGEGYTLTGTQNNLLTNFKREFERLNADKLKHQILSEQEFRRVQNSFPKTISQAFMDFRHGITITLDDNRTVNLIFFDTKNNDNNHYQVVEEVTIEGVVTTRFDLLTLVNGVPFSNIELKKSGNSQGVAEAVNQINRYTNNGSYRVSLMNFLQFFVVSNGAVTKYFPVNPATEQGVLYSNSQVFQWTDRDNTPMRSTEVFVNDFYTHYRIHDVLTKYSIKTETGGNSRIFMLRPYQLYAAAGALHHIEQNRNSLVWHATGSGKTLTSFILTRALAEEANVDKVVMLLDRNDLADQTIDEYQKFDDSGIISSSVVKSRNLHTALKDDGQKSIITTMQSFNKWVNKYAATVRNLSQKKFVFIVDECHRSTFGKMFADIRRAFPNSCFVGFTGTPIMVENKTQTDILTNSLFEENAHTYTIADAIYDRNVLSFNVQIAGTKPTTENLDRQYYRNPERIQSNCNFVIENFDTHTFRQGKRALLNKKYTAMLAADGKAMAYQYWKNLTPTLNSQGKQTAIVFSVSPNDVDVSQSVEGNEQSWFLEVLEKHDKDWGTNYRSQAAIGFEDARKVHLTDVMSKVKNGQIDLLIVSDMLLTGFDAPIINTLYFDKQSKYHSLLQAISRTNRVNDEDKTCGNVILFADRDMKNDLDKAVTVFSNGANINDILNTRTFNELIKVLQNSVLDLRRVAPSAEYAGEIRTIHELKKVIQAFSEIRSNLRIAQIYTEWSNKAYRTIGITPDELDEYYSCMQDAKEHLDMQKIDATAQEELEELSYSLSQVQNFIINTEYIERLLHMFVAAPPKEKAKWLDEARKALESASGGDVEKHRASITKTLEACEKDEVTTQEELWDRLSVEKKHERQERIGLLADKYNVTTETCQTWVEEFEFSGTPGKLSDIRQVTGLPSKEAWGYRKNLSVDIGAML